ncbi:hypothetical protein [Prosthecobacter sp.]|uniref:hypothetical protein n=1 Tax=Prosthecobacter sp. TaxID=1965333 RepID=UPI001D6026EE|nr:hypothetical protein [Prosthecobacter sp.]MCB1277611.1 hypothetical protein [Prosthecobacter sp.]
MKRFVKFTIYEAELDSEVCGNTLRAKEMKHLKKKWPQFFPPNLVGFHLQDELGDPVIDDVIKYLRATGREPNWKRNPSVPREHPSQFQIVGERVWEPADFDSAAYFRWVVNAKACEGRRLPPDGTFEVEFSSYRGRKIGIMQNYWNPICSVECRAELEAQKFKGLSFRPVQVKSRKPEKLVLWQVWSSITLPPVLNKVTGLEGEPFDPATSKVCSIDDLYRPPEYRFPIAKVKELEPFDIALTTECWGGSPAHFREPAIIVSRRFREWFMTQKIPVEWWPVALE